LSPGCYGNHNANTDISHLKCANFKAWREKTLGGHRHTREYNIKVDLKEINCEDINWSQLQKMVFYAMRLVVVLAVW
jgi:hypothetical protein